MLFKGDTRSLSKDPLVRGPFKRLWGTGT